MKKKKLILIISFAIISIIVFGIWKNQKKKAITYREIKVSLGNLQSEVLSTGIVQPENRLEIKPPIAGRAEQVLAIEGQEVKKGQILIWMSSTERAALLDAARARGTTELKRWEDFYKPTPVFAPIDGSIILRNIEPGQTFTTQDSILVMSDRLTVQAQVDETDIAQIHVQQKATITLDAYANEKIAAHVDKIAYEAKTVNNVTTYIVGVLPESIPNFVRSGMTANISFEIGSKTNILTIPSEAVKSKDGHAFVLLKSSRNNNKQMEQEIELGLTDGKNVEVISGLNEGDVILVPQLKLNSKSGTGSTPFSPYGKPKSAH